MFICLLNYLLFNERERTHELPFWIKYLVENVWSIDKYLVVFKSTSFQIFKNFQYQIFFKIFNFWKYSASRHRFIKNFNSNFYLNGFHLYFF